MGNSIKYTVTLLKDLPDVKAGFTFPISDYFLNLKNCGVSGYSGRPEGMEKAAYDKMVRSVLRYKDNSEWVKIEVDESKAYPLICPECGHKSLFDYVDDERTYKPGETSVDEGFSYYKAGLVCGLCGYKLHTHGVGG